MCCVSVVSGARPKVPANQFEDLLGEANFTSSTKKDEPKTIADMRRKQLEEDMDPDKLKVGTSGMPSGRQALQHFGQSRSHN